MVLNITGISIVVRRNQESVLSRSRFTSGRFPRRLHRNTCLR